MNLTSISEIYNLSLHDALPISGCIENGEYFWWGEGKRLVHRAQVDEVVIEGQTYHLHDSRERVALRHLPVLDVREDRKSTRLNSSHVAISYAVFCLKKKKKRTT